MNEDFLWALIFVAFLGIGAFFAYKKTKAQASTFLENYAPVLVMAILTTIAIVRLLSLSR